MVPEEVSAKDSAVHLPSFQDFIGMQCALYRVKEVCLQTTVIIRLLELSCIFTSAISMRQQKFLRVNQPISLI